MRVKILDVNTENVVKGKSRYSVATVAYSYNGEARTQKVMSFANPDVFKKVPDLVGQEVEVTITKNDGGYNQWSSIGDVGSSAPEATPQPSTASVGAPATRVVGSNYETSVERAAKQVYIVKQSSIANAIALTVANKEKATVDEIITTAQAFVDFVFDDGKKSMETLRSDEL